LGNRVKVETALEVKNMNGNKADTQRALHELTHTLQQLADIVQELRKVISVGHNSVKIQVGASSITLKPTSILIESNEIILNGTGKVTVKASGDLTLKGAKIQQN
jgi:phage baseplate assembly protein gpV